jgi:hypothetical protein
LRFSNLLVSLAVVDHAIEINIFPLVRVVVEDDYSELLYFACGLCLYAAAGGQDQKADDDE